ncbi:hypothetical protein DAPPUDRAFT_224075 [Daphnia pulex]|uniref:Uncharacterized protein n=1 Tax=Daphnia pulex TaxID=6669 RepID=E9GFC2_DAPPU|nr:hypothetical protein DAPPUDRAFT_224075 [Daphnia pulex]|eukprot:EFX81615.1 hypothetical protein DAPPUDRAFT_224075 [Daphnia pulex]
MKSSKLNVLIFVTLAIVSIVSAQEVDGKDLELSETKFKKYYIQRHDSGHGGCDEGHEEVVKVKGKGSVQAPYLFQLLFYFSSPPTGSSYNVGGNDEGKGGKGKASGGGYSSGGEKSSGSGSGEQSSSAKGKAKTLYAHHKIWMVIMGTGVAVEVMVVVAMKTTRTTEEMVMDTVVVNENLNPKIMEIYVIHLNLVALSSLGYDSGAGKGSGSVKVKGVTKGKGTTSGYSSKSGSSGSGSGEEGSGGGEKNGNKGKIKRSVSVPNGQAYRVDKNVVNISISTISTRPVVVDGRKNNNKNSRREAPSGAGPKKERSSNGRRHIGTVIGNKGNSTASNGSLILRNGVSASNEKGHNDNGRRSIGTAIGGRSNSSPSSGVTIHGDRGNGRRSVGSVIGDKGNSSNGNKAQNSSGASNSERNNGGNAKRNIGSVIGERNNKDNGGKPTSVTGSINKGKENIENAKRNVVPGKGVSRGPISGPINGPINGPSGRVTVQAPGRAGGRVQPSPTFTRSQPLTIPPAKPHRNVPTHLQEIPYIDILFR